MDSMLTTGYVIVHHDCEQDTHDATVIGPFPDDEAAKVFIQCHALDEPVDGGYAFAYVIGPVINPTCDADPETMEAEAAEV